MENVLFDKKDGICTITLNQPKKMNGLSEGMVTDLLSALDEADQDDDVKVIVITGQGKIFCAGGDISIFDGDIPSGYKYLQLVLRGFGKIEKISKPIIGAVNGMALGGGTELTIVCDIAIASDSAIFGLPEVGIGIMPGFAILRLHQIIGRTRAKELIMTGKKIDATEAERIGLINKVVPADKLMDAVQEEAGILMSKAPFSLKLAKAIVNKDLGGEELVSAVNATSLFFGLDDLKEGRNSFFEKRQPNFKGK